MRILGRYFSNRTLRVSIGFAVVVSVLEVIITEFVASPGSPFDLTHLAIAAALSFFFGAVFERLLEASEVIVKATEFLDAAAQIRLFKGPTELIKDTPPEYRKLFAELLELSLIERFRDVSGVDETKYIQVLEAGLKVSQSFSAVQRNPVGWFFENGRHEYLERVKQRPMKKKRRVFILDAKRLPQMAADLASAERMNAYWQHTGDVKSFWISTTDFESTFNIPIPKDLVLFDDSVVIKYDEPRRTLSFDVERDGVDAQSRKLFELLDRQLESGLSGPFVPIEPAKSNPSATAVKSESN